MITKDITCVFTVRPLAWGPLDGGGAESQLTAFDSTYVVLRLEPEHYTAAIYHDGRSIIGSIDNTRYTTLQQAKEACDIHFREVVEAVVYEHVDYSVGHLE